MGKRIFEFVVVLMAMLIVGQRAARGDAGRQELRFDDGWKFHLGDVEGAEAIGIDDSGWRSVELPHDWSIEGPFDEKWASCEAYLPTGIGWYRKTFSVPAEMKGKIITIRFEGVYENSQVWINGHLLGSRPNGYVTFEYDLTPYVNVGRETNTLAVRVDHSSIADARWYTGSGINRDVQLIVTDPIHIDAGDVFVTTPDGAVVRAEIPVRNESGGAAAVRVSSILRDAGGNEVGRAESGGDVAAGGSGQFSLALPLTKPHLWSTDDPYLYRLEIQARAGGEITDTYSLPIGIRTIRFDANKGFFLNGVSMKIKGVCVHENAGALGSAIPIEVWQRRLALLKAGGCNAIRTSHNPPAPEFLDLCDRLGLLVMDEAFDEWVGGKHKWVYGHNQGKPLTDGYWKNFEKWSAIDLADMVRRDRNHPSVILWSIGNEIDYPNDPFSRNSPVLAPVAATLVKTVKGLDETRPVTAACAAIGSNLYCDELDVVGYNYQEARYADDHRKIPSRVILGSENALSLPAWLAVADNEFISGQFLWTGIDYLGESRPWPYRNNDTGLLDLAGFPRPRYFFRKSLWTDAPMVYLYSTARFVIGYTNCASIELWHDGTKIGEQNLPPSHVIVWPFTFASGTLKAIGKVSREGKPAEACSFQIEHAGAAKSLKIVADANGGTRVEQLEIDCLDEKGNRDLMANNEITLTISGPLRLLGIESGDAGSHENYQAANHKAYRGRILAYLESTGTGSGELSVASPGLTGDRVAIETSHR